MSTTNLKVNTKASRNLSATRTDKGQRPKSSKTTISREFPKPKKDAKRSNQDDTDDGGADAKDGEINSLAWWVLSQEQVEELCTLDVPSSLQALCTFMSLNAFKTDVMQHIAASYHFGNYLFAKNKRFSPIQISTFMGIMKIILEKSIEEPMILGKSVKLFKKILLNHSEGKPSTPDNNWDIFGPLEAKEIIEFVMSTFYQHYRLYQWVYANEQEKEGDSSLLDAANIDSLTSSFSIQSTGSTGSFQKLGVNDEEEGGGSSLQLSKSYVDPTDSTIGNYNLSANPETGRVRFACIDPATTPNISTFALDTPPCAITNAGPTLPPNYLTQVVEITTQAVESMLQEFATQFSRQWEAQAGTIQKKLERLENVLRKK